ncbi:energy-coupling factor transporter transmembrane component T family protein [Dethiobacter alkaliphilus]|uniref:energy-coupling factor transporter transmembrane component T family protein n=1 Tax=Dethiobacter alkaliphilus TaxID=427926 RepID=UPI0022270281|nr:energy-coupling factor transporter transmembrane component T [Dethiobacter alkaliphilus]MCW3489420.1 energy-coupling factor transporter transmembrane protein EcfT [Dethiobacter alkaliphilus]
MGTNHGKCADFSQGSSWAHHWEPRTKTVAAILFVISVVSVQSLPLLILLYTLVLLATISAGLPLRTLLCRMMWAVPFLLLMAAPVALGGGLPPDPERVTFAGLIVFKALTSIAVMSVLLGTQSVQSYFNGLAHMRLPAVMVSVLFLAYRYVFLFKKQVANTQRALASRIFQPKLSKRSFAVYGEMAGGLLLKAVDRSESVYRAMAARGFAGKLHTGDPQPITKRDIVKCGFVLMLSLSVIIVEWRWLG